MAGELSKTLWRTILPVGLGVGVAVYMYHRDVTPGTLDSVVFDTRTVLFLVLAALFVLGRDFGLAWRFHTLGGGDISWLSAIRTDIMCAFTSAITPSVVGGSALAVFYLNREGISVGRATTLTLTTLFLDELFFVVFWPVIMLTVPFDDLFGSMATTAAASSEKLFIGGVRTVFWIVYAGICIWTAILYFAILARPVYVRNLLVRMSSMRWLRRWSRKINDTATNIETTSAWVKGRSRRWWTELFGGTVLSWFSRYFIVNAIFLAFVPSASGLLVFARQFVVWVVLMVSPTPGGSGISEWLFANYYGDLIGNIGIAAVIALVWRLFSYYIYLAAGCMMLPSYFGKKSKS